MGVKATNWAWHLSPETIKGNDLIVLMALADIADDDGNCTFAKKEHRSQVSLAHKARVSLATLKRSTVDLENEHGVLVVKRTGRENSYQLRLDVVRSVPGSDLIAQTELLVTPKTSIAQFELSGQFELSDRSTGELSDSSLVSYPIDVLTSRRLKPSSVNELTPDALALRADDEISSSQRLSMPARLRRQRARKLLDQDRLYTRVTQFFSDFPATEQRSVIYQVALRILAKAAKAGTEPFDVTGYVATAIELEPEVWRKVAFELSAMSA